MKRSPIPARRCTPRAKNFAAASVALSAFLLLSGSPQATAQETNGPMRPAGAAQEPAGEAAQTPPHQLTRPARPDPFPSAAVELSEVIQEAAADLHAAVEDWRKINSAPAKPKIIVLDFRGPNADSLPFGAWLAGQFSAAFSANSGDTFEVIDRARLTATLQTQTPAPQDQLDARNANELAQALGADILVAGRFRAADKNLGLLLYARPAVAPVERTRAMFSNRSRIVMSEEMTAHLGVPFDSLNPRMGTWSASNSAQNPETNSGEKSDEIIPGRNGVTYPHCVYCPAASYPKGFGEKLNGSVTLTTTVTAEGQATDIQVAKSFQPSYDQQAIAAVATWKFNPAHDATGTPVAVRQTIQVTFHVY